MDMAEIMATMVSGVLILATFEVLVGCHIRDDIKKNYKKRNYHQLKTILEEIEKGMYIKELNIEKAKTTIKTCDYGFEINYFQEEKEDILTIENKYGFVEFLIKKTKNEIVFYRSMRKKSLKRKEFYENDIFSIPCKKLLNHWIKEDKERYQDEVLALLTFFKTNKLSEKKGRSV